VSDSEIEVVAQWLLDNDGPDEDACFAAEEVIFNAGGEIYHVDGNDIGGGTFNVFLFTDDVDATVQKLIKLEKTGSLPSGLRIGVGDQYTNSDKTDVNYRAVYPEGLTKFDTMYLE
jgi:hypothetical protein